MKPGKKSARCVGRISQHPFGDLFGIWARDVLIGRRVPLQLGDQLVEVEAAIESGGPLLEVEVRVSRERADAGRLEPFGKHDVVAVLAEEVAVALHLARVATAEHSPEAHRRVRRQRIRVRVADRVFFERRQVRRDRALVARPGHVGPQTIDRDEKDVEVLRRTLLDHGESFDRRDRCVGGRRRNRGRLRRLAFRAGDLEKEAHPEPSRQTTSHAAYLRQARGPRSQNRQGTTWTTVPRPFGPPGRTACHPAGKPGSVQAKRRSASAGARFTQPPLFGSPKSSCQNEACSAKGP